MTASVIQGTPARAFIARPHVRFGTLTDFVLRHARSRMKVRKDRRQLRTLSDHMLEDVGVSRWDIA